MDSKFCACGNKGHRNLSVWLDPPSGNDSESEDFDPVENDELDWEEIEQEISMLMPLAISSQGYCIPCQCFIDEFPELSRHLPTLGNYEDSVQLEHYENPFELAAGDRSGCRLCSLFVQCIRNDFGLESFYKSAGRLKCLGNSPAITVFIDMGLRGSLLMELQMRGEVWRRSIMESLYIVKGEVSDRIELTEMSSSLAPSQLELAKRWLQTCSKNHNGCKGCENNRMPTRLLALGEGFLRLVMTTGWDAEYRPQYATLSHCWGGVDFLKLTTTTLELFKKSMPLEQLTRTFRDTIAVVRKLGIPYLWIDSLCIIQNSSEDWETEATLMSSVYGSSTITIAAAGAVNGNSGLFLQPEGYVGKVHIDVPTDSGAQGWDIGIPSIHETSVSKSALSKRAWAIQERLLSPRILYFTDKELFWECGSLLACESFPERLPAECCWSSYFLKKGQSFSGTWPIVVQLYTQANLTFGSDKLVAISGVARIAQKENNDNYLAGMWRNEMEAQLCWHLEGSGARPALTEPYRAPSWSWASVDGEIPYEYWRESGIQHDVCFAHVLDAWVIPLRPESTDIFGQLRGGTIVISCSSILSGKLMRKPDRPGYRRSLEVISATPFSITVELDFKDEDDSQTFYVLPLVADVEDGKSEHSQSENDQSEGGQRKENYGILGVGTSNGGNVVAEEPGDSVPLNRKNFNDELNCLDDKLKAIEKGRLSWRRVEGLLLRPSGSKRGEFSRKGWFSARGREFAKGLSTHGAATAESCCAQVIVQPKHPGERYLISIS